MTSTSNRHPGSSGLLEGKGRRALVIRIGALGDVLLTRRLCYSLSLAGYRSTLLSPLRHASLLLADPWIDAVLDAESARFAGAFAGSWPAEKVFDVGVLISNSHALERAARLAAANVIRLSPDPARDDGPIAQQWADGARALCAPFAERLPPLPTDALRTLVSGATLIHPGSGSPTKNWGIGGFVELSHSLRSRGHRVVWIRGPAEAEFPPEVSDFEVLDHPSLEGLSATLAQSRLFVGNDSGVSHLAAAVGAPTIALFGPTSETVWRPDGGPVRTIRSASGGLSAVRIEEVLASVDDLTRLQVSRA